MLKKIKLKIDDIKKFCKENVLLTLLIIAAIIASTVLLALYAKEIFSILALIFLGIVIFRSKSARSSHNGNGNKIDSDIVANALFRVLHEKYRLLEIERPTCISEIMPTKYQNKQSKYDEVFFRFIVAHKGNVNDYDMYQKQQLLQEIISQKLKAHAIENINQVEYQDIPYLYVIDFQVDICNPNYYAIDIMVVNSRKKVQLINQKIDEQRSKMQKPYASVPDDDDF